MKAVDGRSKSSFGRGLAIYTLLLMGLILAGLVFFYFYMAAYEYSRPENAVQRYLDGEEGQALRRQGRSMLGSVNKRVQSEAEAQVYLDELLDQLNYAKKPSESTEERQVYALRAGDRVIGKLMLTQSAGQRMGFSPWEVSEAELDLNFMLKETQVTVPSSYQVFCGGTQLGAEDIVDSKVPYDLLEEFYDRYDLPTMVTYSSGGYLGEVSTHIYDAHGTELSGDQLTQDLFTDNCSREEKEAVAAFVADYIPCYVTYLSGANRAHFLNMNAVLALTVEGSDLYSRLYQALGGQGWASSNGDYIQSITVNHTMNLGADGYMCDVTYLVETHGQDGAVTVTTNNTKLLIQETPDGLRAYAQASY